MSRAAAVEPEGITYARGKEVVYTSSGPMPGTPGTVSSDTGTCAAPAAPRRKTSIWSAMSDVRFSCTKSSVALMAAPATAVLIADRRRSSATGRLSYRELLTASGISTVCAATVPWKAAYCGVKIGGQSSQPSSWSRKGICAGSTPSCAGV
jgi:hypothetical protein